MTQAERIARKKRAEKIAKEDLSGTKYDADPAIAAMAIQQEGVAVSDQNDKQAEQPAEETPQSVDELREVMAQNQKGYDKYCELRSQIKEASTEKEKEELATKQERHKKAFKAWKKAYNGLLKQGVSLRDLKRQEREAAEAEAPAEEQQPEEAGVSA